MGVTLADLDRWDPGSIRSVADAAKARADETRAVAADIDGIMQQLKWQGESHETAMARAKTISNELMIHADECDQASTAVGAAASEVESIKSEWGRLQRMADHWGIVINTADGSLSYYIPDDPEDAAEMERRADIVEREMQDLLRRAAATDTRLSAAVDDAISETADALGDELPSILEAERKSNQAEAFRQVFGRAPTTDSDWLTAAALDPHSYDPKNNGVQANVVVGRIQPVPGQGVVRTNLFIPSKDVWAPASGWPPYDNNLGDNRGFSPTAGPEDS
ncbi:MAG: hypothetical protein ABWZ98_05355, partial [Nakamurella sp.]